MRPFIRVLLALLSAAVIPTVVFVAVMSVPWLTIRPPIPYYAAQDIAGLAAITLVIAGFYVFLLGIPTYLQLPSARLRKWIRWWSAASVGFILGCIPTAILTLPVLWACSGCTSSYTDASGHLVVTMVDGVVYPGGWIDYARTASYIGLLGAIGGFAFWASFRLSEVAPAEPEGEATEHAARASKKASLRRTASCTFNIAILSLVVVIIAGPFVTADRSCHNMFRDGRTSIDPAVLMNLQIGREQWQTLKEFLQTFATNNHLSYLDVGFTSPDLPQSLYLSVCNDDGVNIETDEYPFGGVAITVYAVRANANWIPVTRQLIADINRQWPTKLQFIGSRGETIPEPANLAAP